MPVSRPPLRLLALLCLAALAACDSGSDDARIAGRYTGVRPPGVPPQAVTYTVDLAETAAGTVVGTGTQSNEKGTLATTVSGTRRGSVVRLAFRIPAFSDTQADSLVATVSDDAGQLTGTMFGPRFGASQLPFTLTRTTATP